jgi:probable addiction module antidote protein
MKQTGKSGGIPFDEIRLHFLKDPKRADFTLKLALKEFEEDGDVNALLDTLRLIAQAQGGLAKLARDTTISRKALHEALSSDGNPRLRTFQSVLEALGLKMSLKPMHGHAVGR